MTRKPWQAPARSMYELSGRLCFLFGIACGWTFATENWLALALGVLLVLLMFARDVRTEAEDVALRPVQAELTYNAADGTMGYLQESDTLYERRKGAWHWYGDVVRDTRE